MLIEPIKIARLRRSISVDAERVHPMPHYRAYILDEQGHLTGAVNFDCADDEEAKERARQVLDHYRVELWRQVPLLGADGPYET